MPGGGIIAGIGFVSGTRCMVVASDSGIDAGAIQPMGLYKALRAQEIALRERLLFLHLVESAGANIMNYRIEGFVHGGTLFRNLARLSAAAQKFGWHHTGDLGMWGPHGQMMLLDRKKDMIKTGGRERGQRQGGVGAAGALP